MSRICSVLVLAALAGACQPMPAEPESPPEIVIDEAPRWRSIASGRDIDRLERMPAAWDAALAEARRAGFSRRLEVEGRLLDPLGALDWAAPSPGAYRCRMIRIARTDRRSRVLTAFPAHFCHVGADGDSLFLTKETGTERPFGYLWPDSDSRRLVFLGSVVAGDEGRPPPYGSDPSTDVAGIFERIGSLRFRLVIPRYRDGVLLDVFELTPAPVQPDE